jgi:hypothetical protein
MKRSFFAKNIIKKILRISVYATVLFQFAACSDDTLDPIELIDLSVQGTEGVMYPAFNPQTRHYAVRCKSTDTLSVEALARSVDDSISINNNPFQSGRGELTLINPGEDQDIVVTVARGELTEEYTIYCLAEDLPIIEILKNETVDSDGLMLLAPKFRLENGERKTYLLVLDDNGVPRFRQRIEGTVSDFKWHDNGQYSYALLEGLNEFGVNGYVIVILDENYSEIKRVRTVGLTQTDSHDFIITDEGNYIILSYHSTRKDMTAFGLATDEIVGDSVIQEVSPDGELLFEWNSFDYIDLADCLASGFPRFPSDYAHINSVDLTDDGNLVASFRGCAQVLKIDRPTGNVIWQLGGSMSDYQIVDDFYGEFCGQHTALELEGDRVLMFDNGIYCLGGREETFGQFTRILEYRLDLEAGQAHFVTDYSLNDTYTEFTSSQGSVQQLSNGNRFIGWGRGPDMSVTEIDPSGKEVFMMRLTFDDTVAISYRAYRYENLPQN